MDLRQVRCCQCINSCLLLPLVLYLSTSVPSASPIDSNKQLCVDVLQSSKSHVGDREREAAYRESRRATSWLREISGYKKEISCYLWYESSFVIAVQKAHATIDMNLHSVIPILYLSFLMSFVVLV